MIRFQDPFLFQLTRLIAAVNVHAAAKPLLPLSTTLIRKLSTAFLGTPSTKRSLGSLPELTSALSIAVVSELIQIQPTLQVTPRFFSWAAQSQAQQLKYLKENATNCNQLEEVLSSLNISSIQPSTILTAIQSIQTQTCSDTQRISITLDENNGIELRIPLQLDQLTQYHLFQFGEWVPSTLTITSASIGKALLAGYSVQTIIWWLETANSDPLDPAIRAFITQSAAHQGRFQFQPTWLMTGQDASAMQLFREATYRRRTIQQNLSPQHAVIKPNNVETVARWLRKQGVYVPPTAPSPAKPQTSAEESYIALLVLRQLNTQQYTALTFASVETIGAQFTPLRRATLDFLAHSIVAGIEERVRGKDAFFPPQTPPSSAILETLTHAIASEATVKLRYQALTDERPVYRELRPAYLETYRDLHYVVGWCVQAQAERTFRVDRIRSCRLITN